MPLFRLTDDLVFPPPQLALEEGLLAVGGGLSRERLLLAYSMGIFPWYSEGEPILWWSPDPRMVLFPERLHVSKSLRQTLRSGRFEVTMDQAFRRVIRACADAPGRGSEGTWITPAMIAAYTDLHEAGYAHSVEAWRDGELAGGLYGVSLGACFFGESMFSAQSNASKAALAGLTERLMAWGFGLIDCQVANDHLRSLGAEEVSRERFLLLLAEGLRTPTRRGKWGP